MYVCVWGGHVCTGIYMSLTHRCIFLNKMNEYFLLSVTNEQNSILHFLGSPMMNFRCLLLYNLKILCSREDEHMCAGDLSTGSSVQHIQKVHVPIFHAADSRCHG